MLICHFLKGNNFLGVVANKKDFFKLILVYFLISLNKFLSRNGNRVLRLRNQQRFSVF